MATRLRLAVSPRRRFFPTLPRRSHTPRRGFFVPVLAGRMYAPGEVRTSLLATGGWLVLGLHGKETADPLPHRYLGQWMSSVRRQEVPAGEVGGAQRWEEVGSSGWRDLQRGVTISRLFEHLWGEAGFPTRPPPGRRGGGVFRPPREGGAPPGCGVPAR